MRPEEAARALHAYVDGELDAVSSLELEAELASNPSLRAAHERLRELSASIRANAHYYTAPARLKEVPDAPRRRYALLIPAFAAMAAIVVAIGLFAMRPGEDEALAREAVAAHVRAGLAGRRIDVASSDQHTVKPWLSARLPFSPPVPDLSQSGYELTGARLDYLDGAPVATLVYLRRQHVIDVYVSRGADPSLRSLSHSPLHSLSRDGFNLEHFAAAGLRYWIVSDLSPNELSDFARLFGQR
jgi:anti-sigma factor RsiW